MDAAGARPAAEPPEVAFLSQAVAERAPAENFRHFAAVARQSAASLGASRMRVPRRTAAAVAATIFLAGLAFGGLGVLLLAGHPNAAVPVVAEAHPTDAAPAVAETHLADAATAVAIAPPADAASAVAETHPADAPPVVAETHPTDAKPAVAEAPEVAEHISSGPSESQSSDVQTAPGGEAVEPPGIPANALEAPAAPSVEKPASSPIPVFELAETPTVPTLDPQPSIGRDAAWQDVTIPDAAPVNRPEAGNEVAQDQTPTVAGSSGEADATHGPVIASIEPSAKEQDPTDDSWLPATRPKPRPKSVEELAAALAAQSGEPAAVTGSKAVATSASPWTGQPVRAFLPSSVFASQSGPLVDELDAAGIPLGQAEEVSFNVSSTHVRFYDPADADLARRLADAVGGEVRDFSAANSRPNAGTLYLYIEGTGGGGTRQAEPERHGGPLRAIGQQITRDLRSLGRVLNR
jgi:hypothetical protein